VCQHVVGRHVGGQVEVEPYLATTPAASASPAGEHVGPMGGDGGWRGAVDGGQGAATRADICGRCLHVPTQ
jgi:hypothetical protein